MLRGRHMIRVRLAAAAIASLGLAGAAALVGATAHSGTARATPGVPARARASAPRIRVASMNGWTVRTWEGACRPGS